MGQRNAGHGAGADQDLSAARHKRVAALSARRTAADARRRSGILQSDTGVEAEQAGEGRPGRLPPRTLKIAFFNAKDQRVEGSRKITLIEDLSPFEPSTL